MFSTISRSPPAFPPDVFAAVPNSYLTSEFAVGVGAVPRKISPLIVFGGIKGSAIVGVVYGAVFSSIEISSPFARLRVKKYFEKSVKYLIAFPSSSVIVVFAFDVEESVTEPPVSFTS